MFNFQSTPTFCLRFSLVKSQMISSTFILVSTEISMLLRDWFKYRHMFLFGYLVVHFLYCATHLPCNIQFHGHVCCHTSQKVLHRNYHHIFYRGRHWDSHVRLALLQTEHPTRLISHLHQ